MTFTFVFTYFLVALICGSIAVVLLQQLATDMGTEQEVRAFRNYLLWYALFAFSNAIWVWINYGYLHIPGTIFSIVNLVAICAAAYYWFRYVEQRINPERVATLLFRIGWLIPLIIAVALVVTSPFTKLVFYYTPENEYIHGPLYPTMAILAILYLLAASVDLALNLKQALSPSQRRQYIVLSLFLVFPVIGGVIDIIVPNLPIMELMLLLATVLIYTNMQQSRIYSDSLTGLNNRRLADEYLLERIALSSKESPLYFFVGDADFFKTINDQFGHNEGDRALCLIAQGLREVTADVHCHVARWGGDEFVIIADGQNLESPDALMKAINTRLKDIATEQNLPYSLSLSIGYAKCTDPITSATELIQRADDAMYAAKRALHESVQKSAVAS